MSIERSEMKAWLMRFGTLLQCFLPRFFIVFIAQIFGTLFYYIHRNRRQIIIENLTRILGNPQSLSEKRKIMDYCRKTFINLVIVYADLLRSPLLKREDFKKLVEFDDQARLDFRSKKRQGSILVTAHFGNWELAGIYLTQRGYRLASIIELIPNLTETFNRYRQLFGMETIPLNEPLRMKKAIQGGKILTILGDRDLTGTGLEVTSFNSRRPFPKGPATFALKENTPIYFGYFILNPKSRISGTRKPYFCVIEPEVSFTKSGDYKTDVLALTKILAEKINRLIRKYPDQWFVFQPDWR